MNFSPSYTVCAPPVMVPTQLKMLSPSGKAEMPASALVCGRRGLKTWALWRGKELRPPRARFAAAKEVLQGCERRAHAGDEASVEAS